uniref:Neuregulin C-terminal domain-containing protein n=1 Tax=Dicentrarchus labrax TaxID=13489 RepID=A0A8C4NY85_DICLA
LGAVNPVLLPACPDQVLMLIQLPLPGSIPCWVLKTCSVQSSCTSSVNKPPPSFALQICQAIITLDEIGVTVSLLYKYIWNFPLTYIVQLKQRKKLHDRLRQSLRNKRNNNTSAGIGPNLQCNGMIMQHAAEKETETTFSTSNYGLSAHEATTFTHISSQSWSNDWSNNVLSDTESVSVMSLPENSQRATQGGRGRLNATGGTRDLSAHSKKCRDTPNSNRDLFVSEMTTLIRLSPLSQTFLATPGSPPSEMSAHLSSLAISVPSVALSPSGEEECPLLLSNTRQPHKSRDEKKRTSAHYNRGHAAHSLPPSPLFSMENGNYQIIGAGVANGHLPHNVECSGDSMLVSKTEQPQGEHTPFLTTHSTTALLLRAMYSSRTNPASPNDDLQVNLSSYTTKQDPVAV